jgi:threonine aldolase
VHLDGARLWESAPFYGKTPAEIASLFDSVYVSFYKGIGALAGACLAADPGFIAEARLWRKRHGGTLFGMWPNAASALAGLRQRLPLMPRYVEHAGKIATALRGVLGVQGVPDLPHTNMMHIHLRATEEGFKAAACRIAREKGIYTWARSSPAPLPEMRSVELTVGDATLRLEPAEIAGILGGLVG